MQLQLWKMLTNFLKTEFKKKKKTELDFNLFLASSWPVVRAHAFFFFLSLFISIFIFFLTFIYLW